VRHFNGNSSYGRVRAAAFMGRHIIIKESLLFRTFETLCSINRVFNSEQVNILHDFIEMNLPEAITGNEFIEIYGLDHGDKITLPISKDAVYYIRASVNLALREDVRARKFEQILHRDLDEADGYSLGALMRESHLSYSRCSMGSPTTEILINLLDIPHIFGARITGGGCGGLVICLTNDSKEAGEAVMETVEKFSTLQKVNAGQIRLFKGSSDGANISKSLFQFV
jgi:L-arabinokinase